MKFASLFFAFSLNCLVLSGQSGLRLPESKKWVKSEYYIYDGLKDNLSSEKFSSEYSRERYKAFKRVHGWRDAFLEIKSDTTVKFYKLNKKGKRFDEETFLLNKNLFFNSEDTVEVLLISEKCIVLHNRESFYEVYSVYKKRKKVDFCECDIADMIRRRFEKNE